MSKDKTQITAAHFRADAGNDEGYDDNVDRMPTSRKILLGCLAPVIIIILFGIALFVVIKLFDKPEDRQRSFNTLAVMADEVRLEPVVLSVNVQGEARPRTEIDLVPQVSGKIIYVSPNFVEGGIIKKGETLIRIEDSDYQVAKTRAQSQVAQAEQVLAREIAEGEIARQDWEDLGTGEASALTLRIPQRQQAEAALQAAKGDLAGTELQLQRTYVRAPFTGRVRTKGSDLGQFVTPGARLGRIFSTDVFEVRLPLTDNDLARLSLPLAYVAKSRETAPVVELSTTVAGQRQTWTGRIMRTDSTYDTQSRALFAITEIFDPYNAGASDNGVPLAPGLFVDAKIEGRAVENALVIPREGLRPDDEVYVVDDQGKAEIRKVSVIDTSPERAVLRSGVAEGELIILSPMERSRVSMTLKVLDADDPKIVLVEPPKPEWLVKREAEEKNKDKKKDASKNPSKLDRDSINTLTAMFAKDYNEVLAELSEEEKNKLRKMSTVEKSLFMKKKLMAKISEGREDSRGQDGRAMPKGDGE